MSLMILFAAIAAIAGLRTAIGDDPALPASQGDTSDIKLPNNDADIAAILERANSGIEEPQSEKPSKTTATETEETAADTEETAAETETNDNETNDNETNDNETDDNETDDDETAPDPKWTPGVQKRVAKLAAQRNALREQLAEQQRALEQTRAAADELRTRAERLAHYQDLDARAAANPQLAAAARETLRLMNTLPPGTQIPKDPAQAQQLLLQARVAELEAAHQATTQREAQTAQIRAEAGQINHVLTARKVDPRFYQELGEIIHAKIIANRERGAHIPVAQVAAAVIAADQARFKLMLDEHRTSKTTKGATGPKKSGSGRVPLSGTAMKAKNSLALLKTGAVDPNWMHHAAAESERVIAAMRAGGSDL